MKALTIDAYWAWAIARGSKRIENRTWQTRYRGPLAIHAGVNASRDAAAIGAILAIDPRSLATPKQIDAIRGRIIATCRLIDVLEETPPDDPWAVGPFCWLLNHVKPLKRPRKRPGSLGLWNT